MSCVLCFLMGEVCFAEHHSQEENLSIPGQVSSDYLSQADAASVAQ